jgi:hypothetical protein
MQSAKEMLSRDQSNFYINPRKTQTNNRSTFNQFSVSVPNDIPAITTSSFKQLTVPMMIPTLIDLRTCDNSLSLYFDTITTTLTANSTHLSATTTVQMNSSVLNPVTQATSLFLLRNEDNSEILTPSLLLSFNQDNPAITMATHSKNHLHYAQIISSITTATHAQNFLLYAQMGSAIMTATHAQNLLLFFVQNDLAIMISSLLPPRDLERMTATNANFTSFYC